MSYFEPKGRKQTEAEKKVSDFNKQAREQGINYGELQTREFAKLVKVTKREGFTPCVKKYQTSQ